MNIFIAANQKSIATCRRWDQWQVLLILPKEKMVQERNNISLTKRNCVLKFHQNYMITTLDLGVDIKLFGAFKE